MTPPARRTVGEFLDQHGAPTIAGVCAVHTAITVALLLLPTSVGATGVATIMVASTVLAVAAIVWITLVCTGLHTVGCCSACDGTGTAYDPTTSGRCWDCRGTGHPHQLRWWERSA